jgi:hypothetical protein
MTNNQMEQGSLDFDAQPQQSDESLEHLSDSELAMRYQEKVGVNPKLRGFDRETMIAGINSPDDERVRLLALDSEADKIDINETYRR